MDSYKFKGDCLDIDIKGISLCDKETHGDAEFHLNIDLGMDVSIEQLRELLKYEKGLKDNQWWNLELTKTTEKTRRKTK